jgi:hypothetical protein
MLSVRGLVRSGAMLSVIAHALIVAAAFGLLAGPKLFQASREPVMVEIVSSKDVPKPAGGQGPAVEKPEPTPPQPEPQRQSASAPAPPQPSPAQAAPAQPAPARPSAPTSIFAAPNIPALLDVVTPAASGSLEPLSETAANLSVDDVAAFKTHLRKCWSPPPGLAETPKLKVVLRVFLARNGALAAQPVLLAASASPAGPALVQTAVAALRRCQPFSFLPADRYKEWKVLDLNLSPADMAGG